MVENNFDYDKIGIGSIVEVITQGNTRFTAYVADAKINKEHLDSSVITCRVIDGDVLATKYESLNIMSNRARAVIFAGCKSIKVLAEPEVSHPQFGIKIDESVSFDTDECTCYQTKIPHLEKYITLCVRKSGDNISYGWSGGTDSMKCLQEAYTVSYTGKPREHTIRVLKEDIVKE